MDTQKQSVAERVKQANNILVTVSTNPSVDQLAACIGLTLALNKMGKHATAVFSGAIPSTIEFLQPEKTIEKNTDSLRDFIIALDKSKADKLRYKVEDRVVKIFITPYRTSISDKDLEFSQGDFNVDVVIALGVHAQTDLDQAITSHGRILHDASVITMNVRPGGELGSLNWMDPNASSLSELTVQLVDLIDKKVIDGQIATAMLTGIVAETERFSNAKTTPQTMSISAELMSVGANQQLVATKLEEPVTLPPASSGPIAQQDAHKGGATDLPPEAKKSDDGTLEITHEKTADKPEESNEIKPVETVQQSSPAPILPDPSVPMIHDIKSDAHQVNGDLPPEEPRKQDISQPEPFTPPIEMLSETDTTPAPEPESAFAVSMPEPPPASTPPPQIHIDEHGAMSPLVEEKDDIDAADEAALLSSLKPQEPPTISHHSEAPKMVLEPPTMGGQLTANATPDSFGAAGEDREAREGMPGMPEHEASMLDNEAPSGAPPSNNPSMLPPSEEGQDNAPGTSFLGDQPLDESTTKPPTPRPDETLTDIEKDVHSSHLDAPAPAAAQPAFIETPIMDSPGFSAPTVSPSDSQPAPAHMPSPVSVMAPDDLTPDEVATAFAPAPAMPGPAPAFPPVSDMPAPPPPPSFAPTQEAGPPAFSASVPPASPPEPQLTAAEQATADYGNLDNARDAVAQAINGGGASVPEKIEALNASPLGAPLGGNQAENPTPNAPVQPWTPPAPALDPALQPAMINPATQFNPAAFGQETDSAPGAPPPQPPPMMPPMPTV